MNTKKISYFGIISCVLYFLSVGLFLITKTEIALTIWELFTILGAPAILLVLLSLSEMLEIDQIHKHLMLVFMACNCAITGLVHIVNIAVTRPLIAKGHNVADYFRIGCWPSVEMAGDYLAWGFFMGLAFLSVGYGTPRNKQHNSRTKNTLLTCGYLCLFGFIGTLFINENLWYIAPLGYGFGTIVLCIQMLHI